MLKIGGNFGFSPKRLRKFVYIFAWSYILLRPQKLCRLLVRDLTHPWVLGLKRAWKGVKPGLSEIFEIFEKIFFSIYIMKMTLVHEKNKICNFFQILGYFTINPHWDLKNFKKIKIFNYLFFPLNVLEMTLVDKVKHFFTILSFSLLNSHHIFFKFIPPMLSLLLPILSNVTALTNRLNSA